MTIETFDYIIVGAGTAKKHPAAPASLKYSYSAMPNSW